MKYYFALVMSVCFSAASAFADVTIPTTTRVTVISGGVPVKGIVNFKVSCMGWPCHPAKHTCDGDGPPEGAPPITEVFSFSATCKETPCDIHEPFYLNYRKLDHCDIEGDADGTPFVIKNYAKAPIDFQKCTISQNGDDRKCELTVAVPSPAQK